MVKKKKRKQKKMFLETDYHCHHYIIVNVIKSSYSSKKAKEARALNKFIFLFLLFFIGTQTVKLFIRFFQFFLLIAQKRVKKT